jgi:5-methylcytosine-specific restriction endonuclease McrA
MGCLDYIRHGSKRKILAGAEPHWILNNKRRRYIRACVLSAPPWVKRADFKALETRRDFLARAYGEPFELDHIVPLQGAGVCGLTVPWNMRPIPARCNSAKGGKWCPQQVEMFDDTPIQMGLFQ